MARQNGDTKKARCAVIPVNMVRSAFRTDKIKFGVFNRVLHFQGKFFILFIVVQCLIRFFKILLKYLQLNSAHCLSQQPVRLNKLFVGNKAVDAVFSQDLLIPVSLEGSFVESEFN